MNGNNMNFNGDNAHTFVQGMAPVTPGYSSMPTMSPEPPQKKSRAGLIAVIIIMIILILGVAGALGYVIYKNATSDDTEETAAVEEVASPSGYSMLFSEENSGLATICKDDLWGFINSKGEVVIEPKFDYAMAFFDGIACVVVDEKYGYINTNGEYIVDPIYDDATRFNQGLASVQKGDFYGYINTKGDVELDFNYIYASQFFDDGYAVVATKDKVFKIINTSGEEFGEGFNGIEYHSADYCQMTDCYNHAYYDTEYTYCDIHKYAGRSLPRCQAYNCSETAYKGSYCYQHNEFE